MQRAQRKSSVWKQEKHTILTEKAHKTELPNWPAAHPGRQNEAPCSDQVCRSQGLCSGTWQQSEECTRTGRKRKEAHLKRTCGTNVEQLRALGDLAEHERCAL